MRTFIRASILFIGAFISVQCANMAVELNNGQVTYEPFVVIIIGSALIMLALEIEDRLWIKK